MGYFNHSSVDARAVARMAMSPKGFEERSDEELAHFGVSVIKKNGSREFVFGGKVAGREKKEQKK